MTKKEILDLKGKLVYIPKSQYSNWYLGYIYRVDDTICCLVDEYGNTRLIGYEDVEGMREATGEEAIATLISDCKDCIIDMNLE